MEDVLDVYSGDHDDGTVLVCVDETSKQQTKETRKPLPVRPGQPAGHDFEYERNGTATPSALERDTRSGATESISRLQCWPRRKRIQKN